MEKCNYILSKDNKIYYYDYSFLEDKNYIKSIPLYNLNQMGILFVYNQCKDMKTTLAIKETMEKELCFELEIFQLNLNLTYKKVE